MIPHEGMYEEGEEGACRGGSGVVLDRVERSHIRCPFRNMSPLLGQVSSQLRPNPVPAHEGSRWRTRANARPTLSRPCPRIHCCRCRGRQCLGRRRKKESLFNNLTPPYPTPGPSEKKWIPH